MDNSLSLLFFLCIFNLDAYRYKYTVSPSASPTESEDSGGITLSPTKAIEPTASPSLPIQYQDPSSKPSSRPSSSPTERATEESTLSPSKVVSDSPSHPPSSGPSSSSIPSKAPSAGPTSEPTSGPSETPSKAPSSDPSVSPSYTSSPTNNPSALPTLQPSNCPSPLANTCLENICVSPQNSNIALFGCGHSRHTSIRSYVNGPVDGNKNTTFSGTIPYGSTYESTEDPVLHWWEVDFRGVYSISQIKIFACEGPSCHPEGKKLDRIRLDIFDGPMVVYTLQLFHDHAPVLDVVLPFEVQGRIVRITKMQIGVVLSLSEVQVFGR